MRLWISKNKKKKEGIYMVGRPPKENSRDKQYRVRLNAEEENMLSFCSEETGEAKSDIFRKALKAYYENAKYVKNTLNSKSEYSDLADKKPKYEEYDECYEYDEYDMGGISLKRVIECPYCGTANNMDFSDYSNTNTDERQMGPEVEHYFEVEDCECVECRKRFRVNGSIWEYPLGAYNYENINVEVLEEDDEF